MQRHRLGRHLDDADDAAGETFRGRDDGDDIDDTDEDDTDEHEARLPDAEVVIPRLSWSRADLAAWVRWVGIGRVVLAGGFAAVGLAVAWWLLRPPGLPTEAVIPQAVAALPATTDPAAEPGVGPTPVPATDVRLVVHVAGAVVRPGVVMLDGGARVIDAIAAAGGPRADGAIDALNLAAPVLDGDRIEVPTIGEERVGEALHRHSDGRAGDAAVPALVDLNTADAVLLQTLPGVGAATAAAIVEHRTRHGPFAVVDELEAVSGIGPAKLARLRELVTV